MQSLAKEQKDKFINLVSRLSPENISHDGILSLRDQLRAIEKVKAEWRQLEMELLVRVEPEDVWIWIDEGSGVSTPDICQMH